MLGSSHLACSLRPRVKAARLGRRAERNSGHLPELALLLLVTALMRASQNAAQTTFPLIGHDLLGLGAPVVGDVAAASSGAAVVVMVVIAARIPSSKARGALAVALVVMATGLALLAVAGQPILFVAGALVLGAAGGLVPPILMTVFATTQSAGGQSAGTAPGSRDRPLVLLGLALSASLVAGPLAETGALEAFGGDLRRAMWAFVPALLVGALVAGRLARAETQACRGTSDALAVAGPADEPPRSTVPRTTEPSDDLPAGAGAPLASGELGVHAVDRQRGARRVGMGDAWASQRFRVALLAQVLYAFPFVGLVVFGALLSRHAYGLGPAGAEVAFGAFFASSFLVRALMAWRSPIPHKVGLTRVAAVLAIVGLAVLGLGQGPGMLMAGMIVLGVPHGLTMPLASSLVADGRLAEELPSVNAYMTAVVQAVAVVLPPLLGISVGALGYRETFLVLLAPVALLGLAQVLVGRPREQRQDEPARH